MRTSHWVALGPHTPVESSANGATSAPIATAVGRNLIIFLHSFLNFIWLVFAYSIAIACLGLLLFIVFDPILKRREIKSQKTPHIAIGKIEPAKKVEFKKIAVTLDFSETDAKTLQYAISLAAPNTQFYIIHISETAGALVMGNEIRDMESEEDAIFLNEYSSKS